jgi:hypothetical protein
MHRYRQPEYTLWRERRSAENEHGQCYTVGVRMGREDVPVPVLGPEGQGAHHLWNFATI